MRSFSYIGTLASRVRPTADGMTQWLDLTQPLNYYDANIYDSNLVDDSFQSWKTYKWNGSSYVVTTILTTDNGMTVYDTNNAYLITDGGSRPSAGDYGITNTSGYTISILLRQRSAQTSGSFKFPTTATDTIGSRGIFAHCSWNNGTVYFDQGGGIGVNERISAAGGDMTTHYNLYSFVADPSNGQRRLYKNATLIADSGANPTSNINLSSSARPFFLNDYQSYPAPTYSTQQYWGGAVVYNRPLTVNEIDGIATYWSNQGFPMP